MRRHSTQQEDEDVKKQQTLVKQLETKVGKTKKQYFTHFFSSMVLLLWSDMSFK